MIVLLGGLGTTRSMWDAQLAVRDDAVALDLPGHGEAPLAGPVSIESIARGVLTGALAEKRRRRAIERLRDHYIICGYGRVGQQIGSEFRAAGAHYVVDSIADIMPVLDDIEARLRRGEAP